MNKDSFLGIVRHLVTAAGVFIAISGPANEAIYNEASGAIIALASVGWSIWEKSRRA